MERGLPMARARRILSLGLLMALSGCPLSEPAGQRSELQWQDPPSPSTMSWDQAEAHCQALEQGGHSDWRLPSIDELRTLVDGCPSTMPGGACPVGDACLSGSCSNASSVCTCEGQSPPARGCFHVPGYNDACGCFKSGSAVSGGPDGDYHWELCFDRGYVTNSPATTPMRVRCVRGEDDGSSGSGSASGDGTSGSIGTGKSSPEQFPATRRSYAGTPATQRSAASMAMPASVQGVSAVTTFGSPTTRGTSAAGIASADSASCGDGSAFICLPGGCCGPGVTATPSACCPSACCTDTVYCDASTGGCGYSCSADELDCGDGSCCPAGTHCAGPGQCESDAPSCPDGTTDCGDGSCCPSGSQCGGGGSCLGPSSCAPGTIDCGDESCCPNGSSCTGAGECEQPGCDEGLVSCGDYCCTAGDQCLGAGECGPPGCDEGELDCGGGYCCPDGTQCDGDSCMELPEPEQPDPPEVSQPPISGGDCDTADLLAALGTSSSGDPCVDGCIQAALRCAGAAGCVLTSECQNGEIACVMGCFSR